MEFSVDINETSSVSVITLKNDSTNCEAEIYSFGALLNGFSVITDTGKINVIDGFTSTQDAIENITSGFKSAKLSPFVCRLNNGEYTFNNRKYKINKFYLAEAAIHGLLFNEPFTVKDSVGDNEKAFVTLEHNYNKKEEGFPFAFNIQITYELKNDRKLSLTTKVTNTGNEDMPLSDGWHPYFTFGSKVDNLQVQFNSKEMVEFNEQLIPTGKLLPYSRFNTFHTFGDTFLDNCFVLKDTNNIACSLKDKATGLQLNIIPDAAYPYLQVYTPPTRKSIAIENLSSAPDAFNNRLGLIIAKPGEQHSFVTSYQITFI